MPKCPHPCTNLMNKFMEEENKPIKFAGVRFSSLF